VGWAVGDAPTSSSNPGTILKTVDGGDNWVPQTSDLANSLYGLHVHDASTVWACGSNGIQYTSDGGTTWTTQEATTNAVSDVAFADASNGWAVGYYGVLFRTTDGGTTWTPQDFTGASLSAVALRGPTAAWAVGEGGAMIITGDAVPVTVLTPVYRFYRPSLGTHFYTADEAEKANVIATLGGVFTFEGVAYSLNPANNTPPLYRFFKPSTGTHFYTASESEKANVQATPAHIYTYEGPAYCVSSDDGGGAKPTVWRFYNVRNGTHFYTADPAERDVVLATLGHTYTLDGPAFYLGQ
jgi:hypothetical protein